MKSENIEYQDSIIKIYQQGNGEPILLLHGWPTNSQLWNAQVEVLKSNYKVITLDWLGFGKSDKSTDFHYTFSKSKEILDVVLEKLLKPHEKINIVAHDIGGPPAILWAHQNPKKVKRLILLNTVIYPFSTALDTMSHFFFGVPLIREVLVSRFGLNNLMNTMTRSRKREIRQPIEEILNWHEGFNSQIKLKTILEPLKEGKKKEFLSLEQKFKAIETNKYLIIAEKDPLCYAHIKKLSENNPNIPHFIIPNCGHYMPIDRPQEINQVLLQVLEE